MRSCSGLYFLLRLVPFLIPLTHQILRVIYVSRWTFDSLMYSTIAVAIALIKPYKKNCMNILDALILLNNAAISHLVTSSGYLTGSSTDIYILCLLPSSVFWIYFIFKLIVKVWTKINFSVRSCIRCMHTCVQRVKVARDEREDHSDSECN